MSASNKHKLVFVINHYSADSDQHLTHTLHLVDVISQKEVQVALVIERCQDKPPFVNEKLKYRNGKGLIQSHSSGM